MIDWNKKVELSPRARDFGFQLKRLQSHIDLAATGLKHVP